MTHDYKPALARRHLSSALYVKTGEVIGERSATLPREGLHPFPEKDQPGPSQYLDAHAICDNYKTHKTKEVQAWLAKHPRFKLHFTPTSSPWINLVQRLFAEITGQQICCGVFKSVAELGLPSRPGSPSATRNRSPSSGP